MQKSCTYGQINHWKDGQKNGCTDRHIIQRYKITELHNISFHHSICHNAGVCCAPSLSTYLSVLESVYLCMFQSVCVFKGVECVCVHVCACVCFSLSCSLSHFPLDLIPYQGLREPYKGLRELYWGLWEAYLRLRLDYQGPKKVYHGLGEAHSGFGEAVWGLREAY